MKHAKPLRKFRKVIGRIEPTTIYTEEGVLRYAGIGRSQLMEARKSGLVKPYPKGRRVYYDGAELIAWIKSGK